MRFLSLINNIRALANTNDTFLQILQYLNVGHAIPALVLEYHQGGLGYAVLYRMLHADAKCSRAKGFPSRYALLQLFVCLNITQLCHYVEMAEGTGIHVMKMRLKLHELVKGMEHMDNDLDRGAQQPTLFELLEQAGPLTVS